MKPPTTAPTSVPTGPAADPAAAPAAAPPAAPTPAPTGCDPGAPVIGSGLVPPRSDVLLLDAMNQSFLPIKLPPRQPRGRAAKVWQRPYQPPAKLENLG